jgi:hypothetical protein
MTTPRPPGRARPDQSVNRDTGFDMGQAFSDLQLSIEGLQATMAQGLQNMTGALDMAGRFGGGGAAAGGATSAAAQIARIRPTNMISALARNQGFQLNDPTAGQTTLSTMQAGTGMESALAYSAQAIGQMVAGMPLYARGQTTTATLAGAGGRGGNTGAGGPPGGGPGGGGGGPAGGFPPAPQFPGAPGGFGGPGTGQLGLRQTIGARIAASGGSGAGLTRALRDVPGIGLGLDAIGVYQSQREKNRAFQEVEGGSNAAGFAERGHQLAYQLSMLGGMSPQNSALAFQGVTDLGYNRANVGAQGGQNRQSALNFVYHNYNNTGMDVEDSLKVLGEAGQNTSVQLGQLSSVLKNVSDTAGRAGVNAEQMRQSFESIFASTIQSGGGAGSANLAGGLATMQASYGRAFAGTDFSGETSQAQQYMLSGKYGITPGATQYLMQTQPQTYAKMLAGNNNQIIGSLLTPGMTGQISSLVKSYGGANALNPAKTQQIANQFFGQNYNSLNPAVMASVINQQTGLNLTANNVIPWIVNQTAGQNEASATPRDASGRPVSASARNLPTSSTGLAAGTNATPASGRAGTLGVQTAFQSWQQVLQGDQGGPGRDQAASVYLNNEKRSGQRNPVLEGLLQNTKSSDMVTVNTRSGSRVMSLTDAMRYYPNELAQGSAVVRTGAEAGQSVSQVAGGLTDPSANAAGEMQQRAGSSLGQSLSAFNRAHPSQGSGSGRAVTVTLSTEARQLLKLLPSNTNSAAATGQVPVNPYSSAASR